MAAITEDYCSYEVSKLLEEKGFNEPCLSYFWSEGKDISYTDISFTQKNMYKGQILRPTLQMACKWLREKYKIMITIFPQEVGIGVDRMCYGIYRITKDLYIPLYNGKVDSLVDSYEQACEVAIKYCLKHLIK